MCVLDAPVDRSGFIARHLCEHGEQNGILRHIERQTERNIAAALMYPKIQSAVGNTPFRAPNARRQNRRFQIFVLPQRHYHPTVFGVVFELVDKLARQVVFFYYPTVGCAYRVRPLLAEFFFDTGLYEISVSVGQHLLGVPEAVPVDFPLVPDVHVSLPKPADVVRLCLIEPQHFKHRLTNKQLFCCENRKFLA